MSAGYEVRCTEETAIKMKEKDDSRPSGQSHFQAALGIPVVVDPEVPEGHIEVRCNGVLVKRYYV
jgi:hypothetical protein